VCSEYGVVVAMYWGSCALSVIDLDAEPGRLESSSKFLRLQQYSIGKSRVVSDVIGAVRVCVGWRRMATAWDLEGWRPHVCPTSEHLLRGSVTEMGTTVAARGTGDGREGRGAWHTELGHSQISPANQPRTAQPPPRIVNRLAVTNQSRRLGDDQHDTHTE
jgi:hypothetical protein